MAKIKYLELTEPLRPVSTAFDQDNDKYTIFQDLNYYGSMADRPIFSRVIDDSE